MNEVNSPGKASVRAMGFPRRYLQGPGALEQLAPLLVELGATKAALIVDSLLVQNIRTQVDPGMAARELRGIWREAPGECRRETIATLAASLEQAAVDAVVAFGGGKTIDTAKGVAQSLGAAIVICPTIASSDAPTSRLIVLYNEDHSVAGVDYLAFNPDAVIVDTALIVKAPPHLFAAGIGDAISKTFEAGQCRAAGGFNSFGTPPLHTALLLADAAYLALREEAATAYRDICEQRVSAAVERVVEATVLLSGLGFESGGLSVAHALIRGLTTISELSLRLHGELVAYGTLVQLCFEHRPDREIEELLGILRAVDLPTSLVELGRKAPLTCEEERRVAAATLTNSYAANTKPRLTEAALLAAITEAERWSATPALTKGGA
jgi:glycerol dehydrogenase